MTLCEIVEMRASMKKLKDVAVVVLIIFLFRWPVWSQHEQDGFWRMTEDHGSLTK